MRSSSFLSQLAAVLAASAATVSAQSTLPPLQFTAIFTGQFNATSEDGTAGPFGTRLHRVASGGTMSNPTTGEVVASILPFADNGIVTGAGLRFPSAVVPLVWSADGHFASMSTAGVKDEHAVLMLVWLSRHVETDSPTYSWMNGKFFITHVDSSNLPVMTFTMYEETTAASSAPSSS
ncbi:hypothetical protein V8D89_016165 [Ganoderma adspersum]